VNPLLDFSGLPRFADFTPALVTPAVDQLLAENRALIERISAPGVPATWRDFVQPLEDANERLHRAWGVVGHLNAVMNNPELREVYNSNLPKVTQYYTELGQHPGLYARFKALRQGTEFASLTPAQKKIVENELRDFRLGGAELPPAKKTRFKEINERLSQLSSRFSDNLLDATNAFAHYIADPAAVSGIPEDALAAARDAAQKAPPAATAGDASPAAKADAPAAASANESRRLARRTVTSTPSNPRNSTCRLGPGRAPTRRSSASMSFETRVRSFWPS